MTPDETGLACRVGRRSVERAERIVHDPKLGDVFVMPDGSGPWRVVDWSMGDRFNSPRNVLVVELFGD
jgi:hypothetical protein